jgi:hypothetical protein
LPDSVALDSGGYVLTGPDARRATAAGESDGPDPLLLETSLPGVFAAGDVRSGSVKRVASAAGEGAMAVRMVHEHLATPGERRARGRPGPERATLRRSVAPADARCPTSGGGGQRPRDLRRADHRLVDDIRGELEARFPDVRWAFQLLDDGLVEPPAETARSSAQLGSSS